MNEMKLIIVFRLFAAVIFAVGAIILAYADKPGWGWCIFAAIVLGSVTASDY